MGEKRGMQEENRDPIYTRGLPNVYLFINPNSGKPYLTDSLQRLWKGACKAVDADIELYQATRHSVASMAASSGVSIAIIKEVLGHTDIRTTQKYSHVDVLSQSQVFAAQDVRSELSSASNRLSYKY
jgi:site-specific recombinase XerD